VIIRAVGRTARSLAAPGLGLALALGQAGTGFAHAHVVSATPGPAAVLPSAPLSLTLEFDAVLAPSGNQIVLYRSDRSVVGTFAPTPSAGKPPRLQTDLPALAPGLYTVAWTSVSAEDGHSLSQFYAFTVGPTPAASPPPALPPLQVGDTLVSLTATRGDVGPVAFHAVVQDATGKPITNLQRVILRYQPVGLDIGEAEVIAPSN
jgi:methionine-rich copper-binding protein CopC